jgi:hypothetical protein
VRRRPLVDSYEDSMATWKYNLGNPPTEPRARELWLQHAAGFIIFEDVRRYAMEKMEPTLSHEAQVAAQKGIDDAVYGLMMAMDGVSGAISNADYNLCIDLVVRLTKRGSTSDDSIFSELDL